MLIFDERRHENNITKVFNERKLKYIIIIVINALYKKREFTIITK